MKSQVRNKTIVATAVFLGLAMVYAVLIIAAKSIVDTFDRTVMIGTGSAIFGSGLVFFLIQMVQLDTEKRA